ncbi:hypothetical protein GGI43DRAFT_383364 [Trichoderma evansii]
MSGCGYNDPEMLRAAIELAQSFSKAKGNGKKKPGGDGFGGRKEHFEPHRPRQQSRYSQVVAPPRQTFVPSVPSSRPLAPPPSRRNYGASGDFATRRAACRPVIGNMGKDFITSSGSKAEPPKDENATGKPVPIAGQESQKGPAADKNSNGEATKPEPFSTPPRSSGNGQSGNILDAFYAILDKKPSIGQEIDILANMLSKVMDLNAPGTPTLDTPPVKENVKPNSRQCTCQELDGKGKHEKTCPCHITQAKNASTAYGAHDDNGEMKAGNVKAIVTTNDTKPAPKSPDVDSGHGYSHSRKLSPVAPVFVPRLNQDQEQAMDTNGEDSPSIKKLTKGLSASMWA